VVECLGPTTLLSIGQASMDSEIEPFDVSEFRKVLQSRSQKAIHLSGKYIDTTQHGLPNQEAMEQPIVGYRVLEKMGSGGTAVVFQAQNIETGDMVALKLLYPGFNQDKKILKQFINEGMMLIRLDHPNILKGLDFGVSKGMYFLALEFVRGESLDSFLSKGLMFTERSTFEMAFQIVKALAYLESKKIVHRDIKPANILLMGSQVKLCDFAYAVEISSTKAQESAEDITCGTVEYISPEQARGQKDLDGRSDVYSLGITCFHMLTGKVPFTGPDAQEVMRQQIYEIVQVKQIPKLTSAGRLLMQLMITKKKEERITPTRLLSMIEKYLAETPGKK